jgi:voltage-gated potassium channel
MSRMFTIKCMLANNPILTVTTICLYSTFTLSYLLRIFEYEVTRPNSVQQEFNYLNSLWYTNVTFLTIGYGDYCPKTNLGRLIGILISLLGNVLVSILVVMVLEYYNLKTREKIVNLNISN